MDLGAQAHASQSHLLIEGCALRMLAKKMAIDFSGLTQIIAQRPFARDESTRGPMILPPNK
jgi:hypothetical protein